MILKYSVENVVQQINSAAWQANDPYFDGFVTFGIKQDLYRIKWAAEEALKRCPTYHGEDEWLKEQEKKKVIRILKDGTP